MPFTISGTVVQFPANLFRPGVNRIAITALGSGAIPLNTVGITFPSTEILQHSQFSHTARLRINSQADRSSPLKVD
ncbi:hypothetical protein B1A85_21925 [Chroococcidiopsis sp. TS-821]|nr:hypothetical protein B1A85_21925 [Chroococcidiopsis sp. TS-821]